MKNRFISIKTKLILMLSGMAFITLLISSIAQLSNAYEKLEHDNLDKLANISQIMGNRLNQVLINNNSNQTSEIFDSLRGTDKIDGSFLVNSERKILSSYIKNKEKEEHFKKLIYEEFNKNEHEQVFIDFILVSQALYSNNEYIGSLIIFTSTKDLEEQIQEQILFQLLTFVTILVFTILLSIKLQSIFTKPIFELKDTMMKVSKDNDYTIQSDLKSNDEYMTLSNEFNNMINKVHTQDMELKSIHKYIQDSIEYASIIQKTIIPSENHIKNFFDDSFVWWEPKDTVGGDIYLFEKINEDEAILMVIDCTGHGVHGAFVTMLVKAIQKEIITKAEHSEHEISTAEMLSYFNKTMKTLLNQDQEETISNAGFDGGILYINKKEKLLKYSGSQTPLHCIKNGALEIIKGCRQSVGYKKSKIDYSYKEHIISYEKGIQLYISTDGYFDQSGGEKGFCLSKSRFKNQLLENHSLNMNEQKNNLKNFLLEYQRDNERNDDITVIGLTL